MSEKKELRNCPCCGESIPSKAVTCIHCGAIIKKKTLKIMQRPVAVDEDKDNQNKIFRDFNKCYKKIEGITVEPEPLLRGTVSSDKSNEGIKPPKTDIKDAEAFKVQLKEQMSKETKSQSPKKKPEPEVNTDEDYLDDWEQRLTKILETKEQLPAPVIEDEIRVESKDEEEEEEYEEIEVYECPGCSGTVDYLATSCPKCGIEFVDAEELDEVLEELIEEQIEEVPKSHEKISGEQTQRYVCPSCRSSLKPGTSKCPICKMEFTDYEELFLDIESTPDRKAKASVREKGETQKSLKIKDYEEVEEFGCPICKATLGASDKKCTECGVGFDDFDELPDKLVESTINDLDTIIKETPEKMEAKIEKEDLPSISVIAKDKGKVREISAEPVLKDSLEYQEVQIEALMQELDFLEDKEPEVSSEPRETDMESRCPICRGSISDEEKFCRNCGMILNLESMVKKKQISEFIDVIRRIMKELQTKMGKEDVMRRLQRVDSEIASNLMDPELWFQRGLLLMEIESYSKVLKSFDTVIRLNPNHKKVWVAKANVFFKLNKIEEASSCYKKAFEIILTQYPKEPEGPERLPQKKPERITDEHEKIRPDLGLTNGIKLGKMGIKPFLKRESRGLTNALTKRLTNSLTNGLKRARIDNYTLSSPTDTDIDTTLIQIAGMPTIATLNSGDFKVRFRGIEDSGGPDRFYLDYCYFIVNYSIPNIMINKIMYDPFGNDDNAKWMEMYNSDASSIDLTGWNLTDKDGNRFSLTGAGSIPSGGYLVCHLAQSGMNSTAHVYGEIKTEIIIQPNASMGKDAYINSITPTTNYGSVSDIIVENTTTVRNILIQFNITSLPSEEFISRARTFLYSFEGPLNFGALGLYMVPQSCTELGATCNNHDGTNSWASAGDDFERTVWEIVAATGGINKWYSLNLTSLLKSWKNGTYNNYGMLFNSMGGSVWKGFYTCDYTGDTTQTLKLVGNCSNYEKSMLDSTDDLSILDSYDNVIDYVAWGADAGFDDDSAVAAGNWNAGDYINTSFLLEAQTLGRDQSNNDIDGPEDWENATGYAESFCIDRSPESGPSPSVKNVDFVIPEFEEIVIPMVFTFITVAIWRWKKTLKNPPKEYESANKKD